MIKINLYKWIKNHQMKAEIKVKINIEFVVDKNVKAMKEKEEKEKILYILS